MCDVDYKGYLKLLRDIAKIDKKAALFLIKLSDKDRASLSGFILHRNLGSLFTWSASPQGFGYWDNINTLLVAAADRRAARKAALARSAKTAAAQDARYGYHRNAECTTTAPKLCTLEKNIATNGRVFNVQRECMTLHGLTKAFPPRDGSVAFSGYIPIEYFNDNEKEIRALCKISKLRTIYRGPRVGHATTTRRVNAHSVVLYRR